MGVWSAQSNLAGDASGGIVSAAFMRPTQELPDKIYVIDYATAQDDDDASDSGPVQLRINHHHELANQALDDFRTIGYSLVAAITNVPPNDWTTWLQSFPVWWRRDFGDTDLERTFMTWTWLANINGRSYLHRAGGRYYDSRILASRDFWTLFPPHVLAT